jgi:hypothetical protein
MRQKLTYILLAGALLLTACGGGEAETTPTVSPEEIQTQAIETFGAVLTQTALTAPTDTPIPTLTASPTFEPFTTSTAGTLPAISQPTIAATASCYQLRYVSDVSIPDNTQMAPGQSFTKTWKVRNAGSCAWEAGFKFAFVGGEQMSGARSPCPRLCLPTPTSIFLLLWSRRPTRPAHCAVTGACRQRQDSSSVMRCM